MRKALMIFGMFVAGLIAAEMPADVRDYTETSANYYAAANDAETSRVTIATATPVFGQR